MEGKQKIYEVLDRMKQDPNSELNSVTVGHLATVLSEQLGVDRNTVKGYINMWTLVQHGVPEENISYINIDMKIPSAC